jgi:fructose-bisphosphate aldolase class II
MRNLKQCIQDAEKKEVAIGHFNISNSDGFWAVVLGAKEVGVPVIIGVSEGERDFIGLKEVAAMVKVYREETGQEIYLNADHSYSFERVKDAIDAGFDSVIYDGTELSIEENIKIAKECVEYASSSKSFFGNKVIVEAEIGFIGKSSKMLDKVPEGAGRLTSVEEASDFLKQTKVDMLAPAVGNIHGIVKGGEPALNTLRIKEIKDAVKIPLVLHGASGNSVEDIKKSISAGINIIHINTELRVAYHAGLVKALQENPNELSPYKYLKSARDAMQKVVVEKLKLFNNLN